MRQRIGSLILMSYLLINPLMKKNELFNKPIRHITSHNKVYYHIRKGDNLTKIADKFGVSIDHILSWNRLNEDEVIKTGQTLVIYRQNKKNKLLRPGEILHLKRPVSRWVIIKGFRYTGEVKNFGLLFKVDKNEQVRPANAGKVIKISTLRGYGKYILIDHGNGWHTMYSHLEGIKVKIGQHVDHSDVLGNAKNKKMFFLLAYNGKPVNPIGYF